jgi:hypothetical protein
MLSRPQASHGMSRTDADEWSVFLPRLRRIWPGHSTMREPRTKETPRTIIIGKDGKTREQAGG